jgi:hypothetical protein
MNADKSRFLVAQKAALCRNDKVFICAYQRLFHKPTSPCMGLLRSSAQGMPCETPTPVSAAKTPLILSAFLSAFICG